MPVLFGSPIGKTRKETRDALVKKWRAMGCTEHKIGQLIERRIHSKRQYW